VAPMYIFTAKCKRVGERKERRKEKKMATRK
jgi:hypothetical protein